MSANTPDAVQTATRFTGLPSAVQEAFAKHAMHQAQAQQGGGVPTPGPGGTQPPHQAPAQPH